MKTKNKIKITCFILLTLIVAHMQKIEAKEVTNSGNQRGKEIANIMDAAMDGYVGEDGLIKMTLINAYGDKAIRKMAFKTIETENKSDGDKTIVEFLWPADVKGTKLMTWVHKHKSDSQWIYLPSLKRIKRISARNRSGAFMGSEFSYEDLGSQEIEKYSYKYINEEAKINRDCWVIERFPRDKNSGYSKEKLWVDKEYRAPLEIEYYDRKGDQLKTAIFNGYYLISEFWRAKSIKMINNQTSKESIMEWTAHRLPVNLNEEDFIPDSLLD
jgi:hypothetical protein